MYHFYASSLDMDTIHIGQVRIDFATKQKNNYESKY